jgi:L-alanine-DL-glutamate epimerase-like enolase superfamily enzyme
VIDARTVAPGTVTRHGDRAPVDRIGRTSAPGPGIRSLTAAAYTIPTDAPESDGTLAWDRTTMVVVQVSAGDATGIGYTYADRAAGDVAVRQLGEVVRGRDPMDVPGAWAAMVAAVRNVGRPGIGATAISAVDNALWDLKSRLLGVSMADLLGQARERIPAYGSGGFTSYGERELHDQLAGWADQGFAWVKMKVGRDPLGDRRRVQVARSAIGPLVGLFVDGNGAYQRHDAIRAARSFEERDVTWFEEPVSSDDLVGLRFVRDRAPAGMAIAAGEYGWDQFAFRRLLEAGAVDVLQADATRCLGTTGFLMAAALCEASNIRLSSHCAPALHVPLLCAARPAIHGEWFHDHVRIEQRLFDGAPRPEGGMLQPDRSRPGFGLELRESDAEPFRVWSSG